jgi:hypothetical protein
MYAPTKEQADADRDAAFAAGVPFGSAPRAAADGASSASAPSTAQARRRPLRLRITSELHSGAADDCPAFAQPGGLWLDLDADGTVESVRLAVRDAAGVPPALCRLSFAGRRLDDARRTLGQFGVAFWHAKFPHWPLVIVRA